GSWKWKFDGKSVNIYSERLEKGGPAAGKPQKNLLLLPTISDVSTVEEWRAVAEEIVARDGGAFDWSATIVDWPGLGYSDRPKLDYTADVMEKFLSDFINSPDSPISASICVLSDGEYVLCGGGHAATIAARAAKSGYFRPKALAAVAPTWSGPLPIVFGKDSGMESRYGLLRGTLRAPALGWMMYKALVSNEKAIESQYRSHVYADPSNVTARIVESRYELTTREGARYAPAAFLTGRLDPVSSREEFVRLFAGLEEDDGVPLLVMITSAAPKRSRAEMEALRGRLSTVVEVAGALLPQEEFPTAVAEELYSFLLHIF
ncbi:hypothetical protein M569_15980, partial [Genlisea aurea]